METHGPIALLIEEKKAHKFSHVTARVVTIAKDGTPRNITEGPLFRDRLSRYYQDLTISCQIDADDRSVSYGWKVAYERPFQIEERKAEHMFKTLKRINNHIRKQGEIAFFGAYALEAAEAIKAESIYFWKNHPASGNYSDGEYKVIPIKTKGGAVHAAQDIEMVVQSIKDEMAGKK